jgi:hypothetical protein
MVTYPPLPADGLAIYQSVLRRAIDVFTDIIKLYQPDIRAPRDWADITVSEATTQQRELGLRLLRTEIKAANSTTLASTLSHYADTHWADYERVLIPYPIKRQRVEQFHATLQALTQELSPVTMALRQQERP